MVNTFINGWKFIAFAILFSLLTDVVLSQEATLNNYNPRRPSDGTYAGRTEPHLWRPEVDANNASVNRSKEPTTFDKNPTFPSPPIEETPPRDGNMSLEVPAGFLPGIEILRTPGGLTSTIQIMVILTVITISPSILIMTTCYIRILVVLAVLRQGIGTNQLPPSQVITALSLFLTLLIMTPVWSEVYTEAVLPFSQKEIGLEPAFERGQRPIRQFMAEQIMRCNNTDDVLVFLRYIKDYEAPEIMTWRNVPWRALLPAFMLSELKTAFLIGFQIYLPFLVLDMVIASVMVSMGMMMLPPVIISLPFKLMLFVLMDGWRLVVVMLLESFEHYLPENTSPLAMMLPEAVRLLTG
ncbi:MAG: flagellar type III secretion system pore protein FliP [Planctomycetaceae bacterium]|nr:flagellar type III secretion system pore protein FliP [Planctomycetaceae bacterium]